MLTVSQFEQRRGFGLYPAERRVGPFVEVEATRPGRITDRFTAAAAGERYRVDERTAVVQEFHGRVRIVGELSPSGERFRPEFASAWRAGKAPIDYSMYLEAWMRPGPDPDSDDVGPPIRARSICHHPFLVGVAPEVLCAPGELIRCDDDGREVRKPAAPIEAPEGLLAVPYVDRQVELLGEPSRRFLKFVGAYDSRRRQLERDPMLRIPFPTY